MCQDALDRTRNRQNENLRAIEYQTVPEYLNSLSVHEQVLWCAQACVSTVDCGSYRNEMGLPYGSSPSHTDSLTHCLMISLVGNWEICIDSVGTVYHQYKTFGNVSLKKKLQ